MDDLRVWAEDLGEGTLRLTWAWVEESTSDPEQEAAEIYALLNKQPGILRADISSEGIVVQTDPGIISRPELARLVREALSASQPAEIPEPRIRVFAEDLSERQMRLSWRFEDDPNPRDEANDRRRVASWLAIRPEVRNARLDPEGVVISYDPEAAERQIFGEVVRHALSIEDDLRTRAESLARRAPVYGNLAQRIARDGRLSPLPNAARQAVSQQTGAGAGASAALRFVPGATLIRRLRMLLPVVQELASWSREAPPEIVDEHLTAVGLDRATLEADNATAHEAVSFAREIASEKASEYASRASKSARSAIESGRAWLETRLEEAGQDRDLPAEDDQPSKSIDEPDA